MKIDIFLPFPPTINSYYTKTRNGVFISKKGRCYQSAGIESIREQVGPNLYLDSRLNVAIILYVPDRRVRDLDNYVKPLLDTITKSGIWMDDTLVDQLSIYRGVLTSKGSCFIRIREAAPKLDNTTEHRALI
jgi:crossover junction endodeoxyribonuclease RusA